MPTKRKPLIDRPDKQPEPRAMSKRGVVQLLTNQLRLGLSHFHSIHEELERAVFEDPNGYAAKDLIEAMGPDAQEIFDHLDRISTFARRTKRKWQVDRPANLNIDFDEAGNGVVTEIELTP